MVTEKIGKVFKDVYYDQFKWWVNELHFFFERLQSRFDSTWQPLTSTRVRLFRFNYFINYFLQKRIIILFLLLLLGL